MRVGLCGLGTVGSGVVNLLAGNGGEMARKVADAPELVHVGARRDNPNCNLGSVKVSRDVFEVVKDPQVDVLLELIGGTDTARELVLGAIAEGKHVVTANKALIALHGEEVFAAANTAGVQVRFEAAIAGGIPIVKAIREGLAANRIEWVVGIINGTSNYILTEMAQEGSNQSFEEVLKEAQRLGYAEADPTFDVEGIDAAHKLTILAAIAFGMPLRFDAMHTEGISTITLDDIATAQELGYRIRHLGIARAVGDGVELRVHPALVPNEHMLANVQGVMNAVMVGSNAAGPTLYQGAGAGAEPTASAVVADVLDIARGGGAPPNLGFNDMADLPVLPMSEVMSSYYLNMGVEDRPGVMASISTLLSDRGISIEALIQKDARKGNAHIAIITNEVQEAAMDECIKELGQLSDIVTSVTRIRVVDL